MSRIHCAQSWGLHTGTDNHQQERERHRETERERERDEEKTMREGELEIIKTRKEGGQEREGGREREIHMLCIYNVHIREREGSKTERCRLAEKKGREAQT